MKKTTRQDVRLPVHFKPERYRLSLTPNLADATFSGEVAISYRLLKRTRTVTLHAAELTVHCVDAQVSYDATAETVTLTFKKPLPKGKGTLRLSFTGVLNDRLRGFYRSRYHIGGREESMATTQFEPTDARRAFPCVDEPAAKAVFVVTLCIPKGYTAISNTPRSSLRRGKRNDVVTFAPSPRMSPYLVAFIVGRLESIEKRTKRGVLVRISVTPGKKEQARFALDAAVRCLDFYESYFAIRYPLAKLDMIAIPDFAIGAMENWGAITYRETAILYDPAHSAAINKQYVALVVAHEIAHQWFGNLVTMEWWTHLWLNEGFASYAEHLAVEHLFPEWDIWTQFAVNDLGPALELDSLHHTHPIEVEVADPGQINEIFDAVSYSKGASVIRMLADWLGPTDFRDGLRQYLRTYRYGNALTDDLWRSFEHVSGKPVRRLMRQWTAIPGYPVVKVINQGSDLLLTQSRFYLSERSQKAQRDMARWMIPVTYERGSAPGVRRLFLDKRSERVPVALTPHEWFKVNVGAAGVYRVDYPTPLLLHLRGLVQEKVLSPIERLSVFSDAFALARAGQLPTPSVLALLPSYRDEDDYSVWRNIVGALDDMGFLLRREACMSDFRAYARGIVGPLATRLGWAKKRGEPHTTSMLRSLALRAYGSYGDRETIAHAQKLFASAMRGAHLDPDLRSVVYELAAENGGAREHSLLVKRYRSQTLAEEKNRIGRALGKFRQKALLAKTLAFSISADVRPQDTPAIVTSVVSNPADTELAWVFMKNHWGFFLERYKQSVILKRFVTALGTYTSEAEGRDIESFFAHQPAPGAERAVLQAVECVYANADWKKRDRAKVAAWLKDHA